MSGRKLQIPTAEVFEPLLQPARYKGAYGGRGSGKSHFFAGLMIESALAQPGFLGLCVREVQKSLADSAKRLLERKLADFGLGESDGFKVFKDVIATPKDGQITFKGMNDQTAESVKSYEGYNVAWWEEAQIASASSLTLLRPTIREPGSELWFGWNPRRKKDEIDQLLRGPGKPTGAIVVRSNWSDNPWFPAELEAERQDDLAKRPLQYDHIWEGGYAAITEGAYFAAELTAMRTQGRLGRVSPDPLMTLRAYWDIGGTGAKADASAIWIAQFVGREIRVLDYYEDQGQPLATAVAWLRRNGYASALCVIPHDGVHGDKVYDVSYQSSLKQAGFEVQVIENQGKGAAMQRIEAARRLFPSIWINETTTQEGVEALAAYHEKRDEKRLLGLGPNHDWSSHAADAFGMMCVAYEEPQAKRRKRMEPSASGWMAA